MIGRPPKPPESRRTAQIKVLATDAERDELTAAAKAAGMDLSVWMRSIALERARDGNALMSVRDFVETVYEGDRQAKIDLSADEIWTCLGDCGVRFTLPQIWEALEIVRLEWKGEGRGRKAG